MCSATMDLQGRKNPATSLPLYASKFDSVVFVNLTLIKRALLSLVSFIFCVINLLF